MFSLMKVRTRRDVHHIWFSYIYKLGKSTYMYDKTYHIYLSHLLITFEGLIVALYLFHIVGNNILENQNISILEKGTLFAK